MNGFSGNWSSETTEQIFPGPGIGFTDMDFIRDGQKRDRV